MPVRIKCVEPFLRFCQTEDINEGTRCSCSTLGAEIEKYRKDASCRKAANFYYLQTVEN